jgi:hypothetical protein
MKIEKRDILKIVENNWPTHISEVIDQLKITPGTEEERQEITDFIRNSFKELSKEKKIIVEDLRGSMVAWPIEIKALKGKKEILF